MSTLQYFDTFSIVNLIVLFTQEMFLMQHFYL